MVDDFLLSPTFSVVFYPDGVSDHVVITVEGKSYKMTLKDTEAPSNKCNHG